MTPRIKPTMTSGEQRARQVDEAVHSVRMEGLEVSSADAADYIAWPITLDEYGRRTRAGYGWAETEQGNVSRPGNSQSGVDKDVRAIDSALGAWRGRDIDCETYVEDLRSGRRVRESRAR